ncbi:MAG TPA: hypothetical protein VIK25_10060 [Gemmatimonadaceae bacterium]
MLSWLADPNVWIGLLTLTALELVLGIDLMIFIINVRERATAVRLRQSLS